jgi:hypothetical protein
MEQIRLPAMDCPFPLRINPHVEVAHERTLAWAKHFGLVQSESALRRFLAARFAWLTARAYPTVGEDELVLINEWLVWLFLFDDQFDDSPYAWQSEHIQQVLQVYISVVTHAQRHKGPAVEAFYDLCERSFQGMSLTWKTRLSFHLVHYFETYLWTAHNRAQGIVPDHKSYIARRQHSGGMTLAFDLIEFAHHIELPEELLRTEPFQILTSTTNNVVCWSNDIFSLQKERARGDVNNLVVIVQHEDGVSFQEAVERVHKMVVQQVKLFEAAEQALPVCSPQLGQAVTLFLDGLKAWMRANLDWSLETQRYSQVEQTAPGERVSYLESILTERGSIEV